MGTGLPLFDHFHASDLTMIGTQILFEPMEAPPEGLPPSRLQRLHLSSVALETDEGLHDIHAASAFLAHAHVSALAKPWLLKRWRAVGKPTRQVQSHFQVL